MTVETTQDKIITPGNGVAQVFSFFPINIFETTNLRVFITDVNGIETEVFEGTGANQFSVQGPFPSATGDTGSVTYPADLSFALVTGAKITILRELPLLQLTDLENQGGYFADVQETQFDKIVMQNIQQQEGQDRTLKTAVSDDPVDLTIPTVAQRANRFLGFDSNGEPLAGELVGIPVSPYVATLVSAVDRDDLFLNKIPVSSYFYGMFDLTTAASTRSYLEALENVLTTEGDLLFRDGSGEARLAIGSAGNFLQVNAAGTAPEWGDVPLPRGYIDGFKIENDSTDATNDLVINPGICRNEADTGGVSLTSALVKRADAAFAAGTNQGGMFAPLVFTANTTYHVLLVTRDSDGAVDVGFDTDPDGANVPAGWTFQRRLWSVYSVAGPAWVLFRCDTFLDQIILQVPVNDDDATAPGNTARTITLSVPTGVVVFPKITASCISDTSGETPTYGLVTALSQPDTAPSATLHNYCGGGITNFDVCTSASQIDYVPTDTSGQIRTRLDRSNVDHQRIITHGWRQPRGQDA